MVPTTVAEAPAVDGGGAATNHWAVARARSGSPLRWRALFVLAIAADLAAAGYLAAVLWQRGGSPSPSAAESPPPAAEAQPVRYAGELPEPVRARLPADLLPAMPGEAADLEFVRDNRGEGAAARWFVPIAAWGTGLQTLTVEQLRALAKGEAADWASVGGLPGVARFAAVAEDAPVLREWVGGAPQLFADYDALFAAMTPSSGLWTLAPSEVLRPAGVVLQVEGRDVWDARAAATWPFVERWRAVARTERGAAAAWRAEAALAAAPPEVIRVLATGDILQTRCTLARIEAIGDWRAPLATPLGAFLAGADLTIGSLDTSIQDFAEPYRCVETTNLTAPPDTLQALQAAGFDVLTVATNHTFDCGAAGACGARAFLRTLELVEAAGIRTVGGGRNLDEALAPLSLDIRGTRIAILGFDDIAAGPPNENAADAASPGIAPMDDSYDEERGLGYPAFYAPAELLGVSRLQSLVAAAKRQADVVIVLLQSGTEDTHDPSPRSVKAARAAIEAGADLVVGNQAHWVQAIEPRGAGFIAYALGNFIFDQVHTIEHQQGIVLEAFIAGGRLAGVRLHPYRIMEQYRPEFVGPEERLKILGDIAGATERLVAGE